MLLQHKPLLIPHNLIGGEVRCSSVKPRASSTHYHTVSFSQRMYYISALPQLRIKMHSTDNVSLSARPLVAQMKWMVHLNAEAEGPSTPTLFVPEGKLNYSQLRVGMSLLCTEEQ